ncbi:hypothetical protein CEXT_594691 [Caerostris extrusa]|uniref:Uncharacterized protein n=1 Tax=Caerostris extrusa TaxID=172846 RepID=A0AAV4P5E6_CAEEX|nr:hypothetical protein CEXT_594691 [Caerostris extrusa]
MSLWSRHLDRSMRPCCSIFMTASSSLTPQLLYRDVEQEQVQVSAGNNEMAFTPRVALPGVKTPDVLHPLLPGTSSCHEAINRAKGDNKVE